MKQTESVLMWVRGWALCQKSQLALTCKLQRHEPGTLCLKALLQHPPPRSPNSVFLISFQDSKRFIFLHPSFGQAIESQR